MSTASYKKNSLAMTTRPATGPQAFNGQQLDAKCESDCCTLATEVSPFAGPATCSGRLCPRRPLAADPYHSSWMRSSRSLSVIGAAAFSFAAP